MASGMTKTQLTRSLAEKLGTNNKTAATFLETLADTAIKETKKNGVFVVPGLGRLVKAHRKARMGRNPQTGEAMVMVLPVPAESHYQGELVMNEAEKLAERYVAVWNETDPAARRALISALSAAQSACRHFQDEVKPPPMSEAQQAEARKRGLANSKCMRDHGIPMPDPQFDSEGRMTMKLDRGSGVDPRDPKFQAAQKAVKRRLSWHSASAFNCGRNSLSTKFDTAESRCGWALKEG